MPDDRLPAMRERPNDDAPNKLGNHLQGPASLYIVGTPIGNLEDITLRALRTLKEVDLIACEDTRQTQKLLTQYGITTRTVSYHEHNEAARATELVRAIAAGSSVALVTDAGMPVISDPGFRLISLAIQHQLPVIPIPGASACLTALIASGLAADSFHFRGFLPAKKGQRRTVLQSIKDSQGTQIFYEAPHRIVETLTDIVEILGRARRVVVAREVTKVHEEFLRGSAGEILKNVESRETVKGEITLLIAEADKKIAGVEEDASSAQLSLPERWKQLLQEEQIDEKAALKKIAKERGISKSEAYRQVQRSR